jgi:hypothetical protein
LGAGASAVVYAGGAAVELVTASLEGRKDHDGDLVGWYDRLDVGGGHVDCDVKADERMASEMMKEDLKTGICTHEDHPERPVIVDFFHERTLADPGLERTLRRLRRNNG